MALHFNGLVYQIFEFCSKQPPLLHYDQFELAADVKMEIPVLVRSLKSSILSPTSFQMGKTFWGVASAAVEQSRRKANMVAQGDGKFGPIG